VELVELVESVEAAFVDCVEDVSLESNVARSASSFASHCVAYVDVPELTPLTPDITFPPWVQSTFFRNALHLRAGCPVHSHRFYRRVWNIL
jgi:hypothetical protein